jgi:hypothetical protein
MTPETDILTEEALALAASLSAAMGKLLKGKHQLVQGAALADALATFIAGHIVLDDPEETKKFREQLLTLHIAAVRQLIPVCEEEMLEWAKTRGNT